MRSKSKLALATACQHVRFRKAQTVGTRTMTAFIVALATKKLKFLIPQPHVMGLGRLQILLQVYQRLRRRASRKLRTSLLAHTKVMC